MRGVAADSPLLANRCLELITEVEHRIKPIASFAIPTTSRGYFRSTADAQIVRFLITGISQIGSVIPQEMSSNTHARRHEVE